MQAQNFKRQRSGFQSAMDAQDIKFGVIRVASLQTLLRAADGNIPALAIAMDMNTQRLRDALDGLVPVGRELAMHIENTLRLTPSWLDQKAADRPDITPEALARIRAAVSGEDLPGDEDDHDSDIFQEVVIPDAVPAKAAKASEEAIAPAAKAESAPEKEGLFAQARKRAAKKQPTIAVRAQRRLGSSSEDEAAESFDFAAADEALSAAAQAQPEHDVAGDEAAESTGASSESPRRGRRPGQISISAELQAHRHALLCELTARPGSKARLCRLMGMPDSYISHLVSGRRTITDSIAEKLAEALKLPQDYFSMEGPAIESPETLIRDLADNPTAQPRVKVTKASKSAVQDVPIQSSAQHSVVTEELAKPQAKPASAPAPRMHGSQPSLELGDDDEHASGADVAVVAPVRAKAVAPTQAQATAPAQVAAPVVAAASVATPAVAAVSVTETATKVDPALRAAIDAMLNRAAAAGKLDNHRAIELLRILADALQD